MRIAIDYTPAMRQAAGIGRYTRGLVAALAELDRSNEYTLLVVASTRQRPAMPASRTASGGVATQASQGVARHASGILQEDGLPANFRFARVILPHRLLTILWHRLSVPAPAELFTGPVDLFHSTDFVLPPLRRARGLITVHDLTFLRLPECAHPALRAHLSRAVPRSAGLAHHILADSLNTQQDIVDLLGVPVEKISVVPAGVDAHFRPVQDEAVLHRVQRRYALDRPFILTLGTLEPRKNLVRLIEAHARLRERFPAAPTLVIAGGRGWLFEDILSTARQHSEDAVRLIGFVADEDLPALYALARAFAFPSLYEGFGLPPLEAMACGTPVVCSNRPSLPEVVGDAALLVDAQDTDAWTDALERALRDSSLRSDLIERGRRQAQLFTWKRAAQTLLSVYEATSR
jgi:glycosyltransferase involved in cell wall biosynthesis